MILSKKLEDSITIIVESLGYTVYDIEISSSKIIIYIDKEGGVSIGDCEVVSRDVDVMLDTQDPFSGSYTLEVSSPGINRKLKKTKHFEQSLGKRCVIKTHNAIKDSKVFKGILKEISEKEVIIETDEGNITIDSYNIKNARVDEKIGGK